MELKFMTPTEVWEGYDPTTAPLETAIIGTQETGNFLLTRYYFTAETFGDERLRVYIEVLSDKRFNDKRPVALILPALDNPSDYTGVERALVSEGYVAATVDIAGTFAKGDEHTSFPKSLEYAHHDKCRDFMFSIQSSARETPWFVWTKIARRALTFLSEHRLVDKTRMGVLGIGTGAHLTWLVAGTDIRVKAALPIDSGGYLWCKTPRFGGDSLPKTDEERAFSTGVGAETYARSVNCPILFTASSNSSFFDVDRAGDTLALVPSANKHLCISRNTNQQLTRTTFLCVRSWIRKYLARDDEALSAPSLTFEQSEGKLYLKLKTEFPVENAVVSFASGGFLAVARSWTVLCKPQKVKEGEYLYAVPVVDEKDILTAFANVDYGDDLVFSTPVIGVQPSALGIAAYSAEPAKARARIVYNGEMGISNFFVESDDIIVDETTISTQTGPFKIKGVSTSAGSLVIYRRSHDHFPEERNLMLQLDAYSCKEKQINFILLSIPDYKYYSTQITLKGGEFWQKLSFSATDFKDENGHTLASFADVQKFAVKHAENVIFNNILWV